MNLTALLQEIEYLSCAGPNEAEITDITNNSREVTPGGMFVCIKGFRTDGHKYAADAIARGAKALIVTEEVAYPEVAVIRVNDARLAMAQASCAFYGHPSRELSVIGVTGTNGKTTITNLIKSILDMSDMPAGLIGTNNVVIGGEVIESQRTTPEAFQLQKWLRQMVNAGLRYCVMEVSSHAVELHRVTGTQFALGVFTNLTHEHLDFHGTMENYKKAKAKLFEMSRAAIINVDDKYGEQIWRETSCKKVITYGIDNKKADYIAENIQLSDKGVIYDVRNGSAVEKVKAMLPGRFSVYNTLAAYAACVQLHLKPEQISRGLIIAKGAKGRAEFLQVSAPFKVIIDYAHTPDGIYNILTTIREFSRGKIIIVFGAPGDRDATKRPVMGELAGKLADYCIITSDNPASEAAVDIIRAIEGGLKPTGCPYQCIEDREKAICAALDLAAEGDVVLLAGKGHETYQIVGNQKIPFHEEEIVKSYFRTHTTNII